MDEVQLTRAAVARGDFAQARMHAHKACERRPRDAEAWYLLGAIEGGLGDYAAAVQACTRAAKLAPDVAMVQFNLGVALLKLDRSAEAERALRKAIALDSRLATPHAELGNALQSGGKLGEAIKSYRRALTLDPAAGAVRFNLAKALSASGETQAAMAECSLAVAAMPASVEARLLLAGLLATHARLAEAVEHYRAVTSQAGEDYGAWLGLAMALRDLERLDEAETAARRACALRPDCADAENLLATILRARGRLADAEVLLRGVIDRTPTMAVAWINLGLVLSETGRTAGAEAAYRRSIGIDPDQYGAYNNLAIVLREQNRWDESLAILDDWVERSGGSDQARAERSLVRLQMEDYDRGWADYEARWTRDGMISRNFGRPVWDGGDLTGKTILVYAEQGIGDEVMFASCFNEMINRAGHVLIDCAPRLQPLLARSFPAATVFASNPAAAPPWLSAESRFDFESAAGSVPRYLRRRAQDFPALPYLVADAEKVARWKQRYRETGSGLNIGISWRGGRGARAPRCSTALSQWKELFALPGLQLINLQYGVTDAEWAEIRDMGGSLHHWPDSDPLLDLDDFAAQIVALDLVLSVDNATVHLAGALGAPLWILQPHCPDWRWGIEGRGRWYRDVRAFRQPRPDAWLDVFISVRDALHGIAPSRAGQS